MGDSEPEHRSDDEGHSSNHHSDDDERNTEIYPAKTESVTGEDRPGQKEQEKRPFEEGVKL